MNSLRRLLVPTTLAAALLCVLAFAATASAETRAGEAASSVNPAISGKGDILKATASYDTSGAISFNVTTREPFGEELDIAALLGRPYEGNCRFSEAAGVQIAPPILEIFAQGHDPASSEAPRNPGWIELSEGLRSEAQGRATKSAEGTTTTLKAASSELSDKPFSCAFIVTQVPGTPETSSTPAKPPVVLDEVSFAIATVPEPPAPPAPPTPPTPPVVQPPTSTPAAAPSPAPAALAFARSSPVTAAAGKWTRVRVKVTDTGGTAVGPIAFKAQAPAGVVVKPGAPKLPALLPGQSWTVSLQVKLPETAKPKSTITLTGTAGALTATAAVVVKAAG